MSSHTTNDRKTLFDALIEGRLHAVRDRRGAVTLYATNDDMSVVIATFLNEDALSLINGYWSASAFNEAMQKRRGAEQAKVQA
jgi:hypothetical protein